MKIAALTRKFSMRESIVRRLVVMGLMYVLLFGIQSNVIVIMMEYEIVVHKFYNESYAMMNKIMTETQI